MPHFSEGGDHLAPFGLMSVLYLLTSPEPLIAGTDATFPGGLGIERGLQRRNGQSLSSKNSWPPLPPATLWLPSAAEIWRSERRCEINHVYHSIPYTFPVLRFLRNPIVYTVLTSLQQLAEAARVDMARSTSAASSFPMRAMRTF